MPGLPVHVRAIAPTPAWALQTFPIPICTNLLHACAAHADCCAPGLQVLNSTESGQAVMWTEYWLPDRELDRIMDM